MGWKDKYGSAGGGGGGGGDGLFLKFEPGQSLEFMIPERSDPYQRFQFWNQAEKKFEDRDGPGPDVKKRVLLAVYVPSKGTTKVLEMAQSTFEDLCAMMDHPRIGGHAQVYEISRQGGGKDTRWKLQRIDRASDADIQRAASASLPDLGQWAEPMPEAAAVGASTAGASRAASGAAAAASRAAVNQAPPDDDIPF